MIIRIRTQLGTWKVHDVQLGDTLSDIKKRIEAEHYVTLGDTRLTRKPLGVDPISDHLTAALAGLENGTMLHLIVDETQHGVHEQSTRKMIAKDGTIVALGHDESTAAAGFRPGMMPLRSMKMHWTLNEFASLDEQFIYKVKRQEKAFCKSVSLDVSSLNDFQQFMWNFDYRKLRVAFLYGVFLDNNSVRVEFIYEPPQDSTDTTFTLLDDPLKERVEKIATCLHMRRVGWLVAHPPREAGFHLSAAEVIAAGELQLEAADGVNETPFVTVNVTVNEESNVVVEGFQVSLQCMDMVAESVLQLSTNLGNCKINPTFTAIMEGRNAAEVDNNFFLTVVPIEQHESKLLVSTFPKANREGVVQGQNEMKEQFSRSGKNGWRFIDLLADFHLLLHLCNFLDVNSDIPIICETILNKGEQPLSEGYMTLIRYVAGLDE